jgi:hypothetical protein
MVIRVSPWRDVMQKYRLNGIFFATWRISARPGVFEAKAKAGKLAGLISTAFPLSWIISLAVVFLPGEAGRAELSNDDGIEGPRFTVTGVIKRTVPATLRLPEHVSEVDFTVVVDRERWTITVSSRNPGSTAGRTVRFYDGESQYVFALGGPASSNKPVPANVHDSFIPFGGGFTRFLWFAFCSHQWLTLDPDAFPNFASFAHPPPLYNTTVMIRRDTDGKVLSKEIFFPFHGVQYLCELTQIGRYAEINGTVVPMSLTREVFARLGYIMEGRLVTPRREYKDVLERYDLEVTSLSSSVDEIEPPSLHGQTVAVDLDTRFGGHEAPVQYRETNRFRTRAELESDPAIRRLLTGERGAPAGIIGNTVIGILILLLLALPLLITLRRYFGSPQ